jgi:hypothetical protein
VDFVIILVVVAVAVAAKIKSGIHKDHSEAIFKETKVWVWKHVEGWNPVAKEEISEYRWVPIQATRMSSQMAMQHPDQHDSGYVTYSPKDVFYEENIKFRDRSGNDLDRDDAYERVSAQKKDIDRLDGKSEWWNTLFYISGFIAVLFILFTLSPLL